MDAGYTPGALPRAHKLLSSAPVLEHEVAELRLLVERYAGILLDCPSDNLSAHIMQYMEKHHLGCSSEFFSRLQSPEGDCDAFLEDLLDGETAFFRNPMAFQVLEKKVLPELKARKSCDGPWTLRVWSAGCSTGEEAYSIAMSVCQAVDDGGGGWNIHVLGSDIRRGPLAVAERGLYPPHALAQVPRNLLRAYFVKVGEHFLVKPRLRSLVSFAPMNLARSAYVGRFDCIFCIDVLPHFSSAQRLALVERLHLYLEPGGYLFLGAKEKLPRNAEVTFQVIASPGYTLYRKPLAAAARSGR